MNWKHVKSLRKRKTFLNLRFDPFWKLKKRKCFKNSAVWTCETLKHVEIYEAVRQRQIHLKFSKFAKKKKHNTLFQTLKKNQTLNPSTNCSIKWSNSRTVPKMFIEFLFKTQLVQKFWKCFKFQKVWAIFDSNFKNWETFENPNQTEFESLKLKKLKRKINLLKFQKNYKPAVGTLKVKTKL